MRSVMGAIGSLVEEWGFTVYYGANGADLIRIPGGLSRDDRYVRINEDMLIVHTGGVQKTVLSVPLGSPDSLDKLKSVLYESRKL